MVMCLYVLLLLCGLCGFAVSNDNDKNKNKNNNNDLISRLDMNWNLKRRLIMRGSVTSNVLEAEISNLADGDYVVIHSFLGSYINKPSSQGTANAVTGYKNNRIVWRVIKTGSNYQFQNYEENCYLTGNSGNLKCLTDSTDSKSFWKYDIGTFESSSDDSGFKRYYGKLKNNDNSKCVTVGSIEDSNIAVENDCNNGNKNLLLFKIVG